MKKSDLVKVIREIVKQEIKKELPNALAHVFAQMMGQASRPEIHSINTVRKVPTSVHPVPQPEVPDEVDEMATLKSQLQEMFNGGTAPVQRVQQQQPPQQKQFTKNPVLNEILNQTRPFNGSERMAMSAGGGFAGGGMSPAVAMAAGSYASQPSLSETGAGQMMDASELGFLKKIPGMPGSDQPMLAQLPASTGHSTMSDDSIPAAGLGQISALDIKNHPALPDSIKGILNRDYRSLVKAMDKKK